MNSKRDFCEIFHCALCTCPQSREGDEALEMLLIYISRYGHAWPWLHSCTYEYYYTICTFTAFSKLLHPPPCNNGQCVILL